MIGRRSFLTSAATAAIGVMVLDPEKLLWVPGQRSYFDIRRPVRVLGVGYQYVGAGERITTATYPKSYVTIKKDGVVFVSRIPINRKLHILRSGGTSGCPCGMLY